MLSVYVGGHDGVTALTVLARRHWEGAVDIKNRAHVHIDPHMDVRTYEHGRPTNGSPVRVLREAGMPGENIVLLGAAPFRNWREFAQWAIDEGMQVVPGYRSVTGLTGHLDALANKGVRAISVTCDIDSVQAADVPAAPGARPIGIAPLALAEAAFEAGRHSSVDIVNVTEVAIDRSVDPNDRTAQLAAEIALYAMAGAGSR